MQSTKLKNEVPSASYITDKQILQLRFQEPLQTSKMYEFIESAI